MMLPGRLPLAPLCAELGIVMGSYGWATLIAELAAVEKRTVHRWVREGVPERAADRLATVAGTHLSLVWPDWYWSAEVSA